MNFITISDEEWIREQFGNTLAEKMMGGDVDAVLGLFWRILDNEGKKIVATTKIRIFEGLEEKEFITDEPIEKLKRIISGEDEITAIMHGIFDSRAKSNPEPVEIEKKSPKVAQP